MEKLKKINPIVVALWTFWIPYSITKLAIPEIPKTVFIWVVIALQIYLLYIGIERLKGDNKKA